MIDSPNLAPASRPFVDADTLSRVVKMALDAGEVGSIEAGYDLFRTYRLAVVVGPELPESVAHQAALLTIVSTARRAMLGGVVVDGPLDRPLLAPLPGYRTLAEAVTGLGGQVGAASPGMPVLTLGEARPPQPEDERTVSLAVTFQDWRGGVIPTSEGRRLREDRAMVLAATLAGAVGVSEMFQLMRGNPMAGRRSAGLSLWMPDHPDWETAPPGPGSVVLPSRLWLIGLGHLGQAYLWALGLLPYRSPCDVELVLQDFDRLTLANDSTSLLTSPEMVGRLKTRAMAAWAEARGFRTRLVERVFPGGIRVADDEPRLALGGVDNPAARAAYEDASFDCVIEAGLGAGPTEYLAMRMHAFPGSRAAQAIWGQQPGRVQASQPRPRAYAGLDGLDECGLVRLSSRTVGAPFVGTTAAALVIAEVLRRLNAGPAFEVIDLTLRDINGRSFVAGRTSDRFNPGYTR